MRRYVLIAALVVVSGPGRGVLAQTSAASQQAEWTPLVARSCSYPDPDQGRREPRSDAFVPRPAELAEWLRLPDKILESAPTDFHSRSFDEVAAAVRDALGIPMRLSDEIVRTAPVGSSMSERFQPLLGLQVDVLLMSGGGTYPLTLDSGELRFVTRDEYAAILRMAPERASPELLRHVSVRWDPVERHDDQDGRYLVVSGRVSWREEDGSETPVTWMQPVRVAIARRPGVEPDWSGSARRPDTIFLDAQIADDASFSVHVPAHELERRPGELGSYAVGAVLPATQLAGTWASFDRVLPSSRSHLPIPGPAPLSQTQRILSAVSGPSRRWFDPIALVRAVNHLRALGKDAAIEALREFATIAPPRIPGDDRRPVAGNSDHADARALFLVVNLLFEPSGCAPSRHLDPSGRPIIWLIEWGSWDSAGAWQTGGGFTMQKDIPFLAGYWAGGSGLQTTSGDVLDWARECGELRPAALRPDDDPLAAADRLVELGATAGGDPRREIWLSLGDLVGLPLADSLDEESQEQWGIRAPTATPLPIPEKAWERFRAAVRAAGLRWDERAQTYVRTR